jgi:hypothetical protein
MRGNSTFKLLRNSSLAALLSVSGLAAFGQPTPEPTPGEITQQCQLLTPEECIDPNITFEHESGVGGDMYNFTSDDFILEGANSQNANSDFFLKSTPVISGDKRLNSFWFKPNKQALSVDYRFELSGTASVTTYRIYLQSKATGTFYPVCTATVQLSNSGPATVCGTAGVPLALALEGEFRFVFFFSIEGANSHYIKFDNFGSNLLLSEATLPVNFIGLTAKKATKGTEVRWNVAEEMNVSRYEVQKGTNAGDLKTIGIVFAGEKTSYSFIDENPSQGLSFYRIRSVDNDGKFKFSTVISFSNGRSAAVLRAFPMPAQNQVTIQHGTIEGKAQISIAAEDGRIVKRQLLAAGSMQTAVDLTGLKAGLYLVRLENSNGEVETLKLIKQ